MTLDPSSSSATVPANLLCAGCGYNLAGLPESGKCPECETSIAISRENQIFVGKSSHIIRDMRRGALLIAWAQALHIVVFLLSLFALGQAPGLMNLMIVITGAFCLTGSMLTAIGGILASCRWPFHTREGSSLLRVTCLAGSILLAIISGLATLRIVSLIISQPLEDPVLIPIVLLGIIVVLASSVATAFLTEWMATIARASAKHRSSFYFPRPLQPHLQPLFVLLPIILGPVGGLISSGCCYSILKRLEADFARQHRLTQITRS